MNTQSFNVYQDEALVKDNKIYNIDLYKLKQSLVKFEIGNQIGSGFFYLFKDNDLEIPVFVTNNHMINLDHLIKGKKIEICVNNSQKEQEIQIKENTKRFTNKCLDVTMIEVEKSDLLKFLEFDDEETKEEENICILQHPGGREASFSNGIIKSMEGFNIKYDCSTEAGSSGSPILNSNNFQVLGVHKSYTNSNTGTLIKYANDRFLKTIKNEIIYDFMNVENKNSTSKFYKKIKLENNDEYEGELIGDNIREGYGWCKSVDNYIYKGEYKNNKRNGFGTLLKIKNNKKTIIEYEGYWKDDQMLGNNKQNLDNGEIDKKQEDGEIKDTDKTKCESENNNNLQDGYVEITYPNGNKYEGEFKNGLKEGKGILIYPNGDKYDGEWKNDEKEGHGIKTYFNGDKYDGEWKNNVKEGHGVLILANKDKYDGDFKNNFKEGQGEYIWGDGDKYVGEWKNNNMDGHGEFISAEGDKYDGEWKNNVKEGHGILILSNKDKYDGEFKNNVKEGYGEYTWVDGDFYHGEWKNNKKEGHGVFISASGNKYKGEWKNNKMEGKGEYYWPTGDKYVGEWKNNLREGHGVKIYEDGNKYVGEWKNNVKEGHGIYTWVNGDKYDGEWKNNKKDGHGIFILASGDKYDGEWKNDKKDGHGKFILASGEKYEGDWENDRLVKECIIF